VLRGRTVSPVDAQTTRWVEQIRADFGEGCFACGRDNPQGLHLDRWDLADGEVSAVFEPREHHIGAGDTLHGGLAATVLDEALVWAGIMVEKVLTVTGTLDLRFRRPLYVADTITAVGRVEERSGRRVVLSGRLETERGTAVSAKGLYVVSREFEEPAAPDSAP